VIGTPRLAATRLNLLRARRRLERMGKGAALLRRKREALVGELFKVARPAVDARARLSAQGTRAGAALLEALGVQGGAGVRALGWPYRDLALELRAGQLWGIPVADLVARPPVVRTPAARGTPPGSVGPAAVAAAREFEALVELLLDAAPREMLLRRLGEALAQASRQVNTLERRLLPALRREATGVRRVLDEREREDRLRLKHLLKKRERGAGSGT